MAGSVEEALEEVIVELKAKDLVEDVFHLADHDKDLPGLWKERLLAVLHKVPGKNGHTFSKKIIYIEDLAPFKVLYHYGGAQTEEISKPTRDFFSAKLPQIKQAKSFDFVEIETCSEESESVIVYAIKEKSIKLATIFRVKCWKTGATTFDWLIIEQIDIAL